MRRSFRIGFLALTSIALAQELSAAPVVTAEFVPPLGLSGGFNIGAGMAIDPPAPTPFDNRLAQTFVAAVGGRPATASIIATRSPSTDAPLWVDIVTMNGSQVVSVLASGSVPPSTFPSGFSVDPLEFNGIVALAATDELVAGEQYAMVLRSATPDANYRVYGTHEVNHPQSEMLRSQNSPIFQSSLVQSDLFFQVTVEPVPEPAGVMILACGMVGLWRLRRIR